MHSLVGLVIIPTRISVINPIVLVVLEIAMAVMGKTSGNILK